MRLAFRPGLALAAILSCGALTSGREQGLISFPADYRFWAHVKSALVGPQSDAFSTEAGIHHIYANGTALEGYRTGDFPDGSILVYDLLETLAVRGNVIEGRQRRVDVMVKDERYASTGGWGFSTFAGADRKPQAPRADCFGCHQSCGNHDYVFSEFRSLSSIDSSATRQR